MNAAPVIVKAKKKKNGKPKKDDGPTHAGFQSFYGSSPDEYRSGVKRKKKSKRAEAIKLLARELRQKVSKAATAVDRTQALLELDALAVASPMLAKSAKRARKQFGQAGIFKSRQALHEQLVQEYAARPAPTGDLVDADPRVRDRAWMELNGIKEETT